MTDARRVAARATVHDPRAVTRARAVAARAGQPTRRARRALAVVARHEARRREDLALGAALRSRERSRRAGTMPHQPSGKHQRKLAARRATREEEVAA